MASVSTSPDASARGLTTDDVAAVRYDGATFDPREPTGLLNAMMPSRVRVLDVGCGTGTITALVNRDRGNEVVAVEPDSDRAALARERGLTVHNAMLDDELQQSLGLFDVVTAVDVLEHTVSPAEFLRTLGRSLKPGGLLLLSVPNVAHWSVRWMLLRGRFDYEPTGIMDATHLRWFTDATLRKLLEAEGYEVLETRHTIGSGLPCYTRGPIGLIPYRLRRKLIVAGTAAFPRLFGVQHIIKARRAS